MIQAATVAVFGPEYQKIQTVFKRDERNVIVPGDWTLPEFDYLADRPWRWTEKVDGTNVRIHWNGENVTVGGRTDNAQIPTFLVSSLVHLNSPELWSSIFDADSTDVTVYGEGYGPKIQKGGQYREDVTVIVFDVRVGQWWLEPASVADIAAKLGLETVPELPSWTLREAVGWVERGNLASHWPNAQIEGLVGTPLVSLFNRMGERIITKVKVKDFRDLARRAR